MSGPVVDFDRRDCGTTGLKLCDPGLGSCARWWEGVFRVDALLEGFPLDEPEGGWMRQAIRRRGQCHCGMTAPGSTGKARVLLADSANCGAESVAQDSMKRLSKWLEFATITACWGMVPHTACKTAAMNFIRPFS